MKTVRLVTSATTANPNVHDIYLDDSGQPEMIGGDITDADDYAMAVAQKIKTRLMFVRGEWYLDQRQGTPWRERVWAKGTTAETIRRVVREVAESTPGVDEVSDIDVTVNAETRTATIDRLVVMTDTRQQVSLEQLDTPMIIEVPRD